MVRAGVADVVDGVSGLDDACLTDRFRTLEAERRRIEAELVTVIGEADRRCLHTVDGHASVRGWCRAMTRWSMAETGTRTRLARLLKAAPDVAAALADGVIGTAQCDLLARAFTNPRCGTELLEIIPLLIRHAQHLSYEEFRIVIRRWEQLADLDGSHRDTDTAHRNRHLTLTEHDGIVHLTATGAGIDAAELAEIHRRYLDAEFHTDWDWTRATYGNQATPALMPRTHHQRAFDALIAIFRDAASTPADAQAPEPVVNLIISLDAFDTALLEVLNGTRPATPAPPDISDPRWWRSETLNGLPITPTNAAHAAIIGHVRRVVINSAGVVVDLGRKRRLFTGAARDAVLMMSTRCSWPGCSPASGRTQADHTTDHQHGGTTSTHNGGPACPRHNRYKNHGYHVHRDTNGYWHTYRPDGTEIV